MKWMSQSSTNSWGMTQVPLSVYLKPTLCDLQFSRYFLSFRTSVLS